MCLLGQATSSMQHDSTIPSDRSCTSSDSFAQYSWTGLDTAPRISSDGMTMGYGPSQVLWSTIPMITYKEATYAATDIVATITQAQHPGPPGPLQPQQLPLNPLHQAQDLDDDYRELDALLHYTGLREFLFFRPDPLAFGRPTSFLYQTTPFTTQADLHGAILQHWPDLRQAQFWTLTDINHRIRDSNLLPSTQDPFLVEASVDMLTNTQIPIMLEVQSWDIATGALQNYLLPKTLDQTLTRLELFQDLGLEQLCLMAPCTVMINGQVHDWLTAVSLWTADYVRVGVSSSVTHVHRIIAPVQTLGPLSVNDLPPDFAARAITQAAATDAPRQEVIETQAQHQQLALSHDAQEIYASARLHTLTGRMVGLFRLTQQPDTYLRLQHDVHRDPFTFHLHLVMRNLIGYEVPWEIIPIHPSVRDSHLPTTQPYVGLLRQGDRFLPNMRMILTECHRFVHRDGGRSNRVGLRLIMMPRLMDVHLLLITLDKLDDCVDLACTLRINGRDAAFTVMHRIEDGDFLQLAIYDTDEEPPKKARKLLIQTSSETTSRSSTDLAHQEPPSSTSSTSGILGPSPPPGLGIQLCSWVYLFWILFGRLGTSIPDDAPCPRDRWCASKGVGGPTRWPLLPFWLQTCICLSLLPIGHTLHLCVSGDCRIGEANHPGPPIWIGTTNPSGLRGKEFQYGSLPDGIWGVSETHLAAVSQHRIGQQMRRSSSNPGVSRFFLPGAPVPLRARSATEGCWAGVAYLTDLAPRAIHIHWPANEFALGRVQLAQFWIGSYVVTGANLYLWPSGPTWPRALEASRHLLDTLTRELVYSRSGPRFILGDFNHTEHQLPSLTQWRDQGWIEVQELAARLSLREHTPTFRGASTPDQIWLSPELARYYEQVSTWHLFADHLTFSWTSRSTRPTTSTETSTLSDQYKEFWQQYEDSFSGYVKAPDSVLPANHRG